MPAATNNGAAAAEKPTIVISHGAWHGPPAFKAFAAVLQARGFPVVCRRHPTCRDDLDFGQNTLYDDDAAALHAEVAKQVTSGKTVYVLAHSYGGNVMTEAITSDLQFGNSNGRAGGVAGLIYLCAFLNRPGTINDDQYMPEGSDPVPYNTEDGRRALVERSNAIFDYDEAANSVVFKEAKAKFYHDLGEEEQAHWMTKLVPMSRKPFFNPVTNSPYLQFPVMYIYCTNDQAIPYEVQKGMVAKAKKAGADIVERVLEYGHSPFLNDPKGTVAYVEEFINAVEQKGHDYF